MNNTEKYIIAASAALTSILTLWLLQAPQTTGSLQFAGEITAEENATTSLYLTGLRRLETTQWKNLSLEITPSTSRTVSSTTRLPVGTYSEVRFEIRGLESVATPEFQIPERRFSSKTLLKINPQTSSQLKIELFLSDSTFPTTDLAELFLPHLEIRTTQLRNQQQRLTEVRQLWTDTNGDLHPFSIYETETIFQINNDGSIQIAPTGSTQESETAN